MWPDACAGCGMLGTPLCANCLAAAPCLGTSACPTCAGPLPPSPRTVRASAVAPPLQVAPAVSAAGTSVDAALRRDCPACRGAAYRWVAVVAPYSGPWRRWIHTAKFGPDPALGRALAQLLARRLASEELDPQWLLVPLPPTNRTSVLRGPHLPTLLARVAARELGLGWAPLVYRRRPGRPQRRRAAAERGTLAAAAFVTTPLPRGVRGVVLVDDVMTTGATLAAVAGALAQRWPGLGIAAAVVARAGAPLA